LNGCGEVETVAPQIPSQAEAPPIPVAPKSSESAASPVIPQITRITARRAAGFMENPGYSSSLGSLLDDRYAVVRDYDRKVP
jgi:hypothetical protein